MNIAVEAYDATFNHVSRDSKDNKSQAVVRVGIVETKFPNHNAQDAFLLDLCIKSSEKNLTLEFTSSAWNTPLGSSSFPFIGACPQFRMILKNRSLRKIVASNVTKSLANRKSTSKLTPLHIANVVDIASCALRASLYTTSHHLDGSNVSIRCNEDFRYLDRGNFLIECSAILGAYP